MKPSELDDILQSDLLLHEKIEAFAQFFETTEFVSMKPAEFLRPFAEEARQLADGAAELVLYKRALWKQVHKRLTEGTSHAELRLITNDRLKYEVQQALSEEAADA